jgi:hypothetical protein
LAASLPHETFLQRVRRCGTAKALALSVGAKPVLEVVSPALALAGLLQVLEGTALEELAVSSRVSLAESQDAASPPPRQAQVQECCR